MADNRCNPDHTNYILKVIVIGCSLKNYDRSYKIEDKEGNKLYYCTQCRQMHRESSRIGINHKLKIEADRQNALHS